MPRDNLHWFRQDIHGVRHVTVVISASASHLALRPYSYFVMQCILFSFGTMIMIVVSVETLFICRFMLLAVWVVAATGIWRTVDLCFHYGNVRIVVYKTQGIFQWNCSLENCLHFLIKLQSPKLSCFQVFTGGHVLRSQAALVSIAVGLSEMWFFFWHKISLEVS